MFLLPFKVVMLVSTLPSSLTFNNTNSNVVTSANSGMGFDTAKYLADEAAKVYIIGRNAEAIDTAASQIGKNTIC